MAENGFCRYCGNKVTSDNRFCPNCGANLGSQFGVGSDNVNTSNFQNINYNPYVFPASQGYPVGYAVPINPAVKKAEDLATAALVLSIIGIWFFPCTILGNIFRVKAKKDNTTKTGFQTASLILNILGYIFAAMWLIMIVFMVLLMMNGPYY